MGKNTDWEQLLAKYEQLLEMRGAREALEAQGILRFEGEAAVERAALGKALARRFPGALREMDELEATALRARRDHLREVVQGGKEPALWAQVMHHYHACWRHALGIKGWLGTHNGKETDAAALIEPFRGWYAQFPHRQEKAAAVDADWLRRYQRPPEGRLHNVVWPQLTREFGLDTAALKGLLFEVS